MALTLTWQDGFEGAENLATVYGAGNVDPGTTILTGQGRGGGNALNAFGTGLKNVATGIAAATDPIQIGLANNHTLGGAAIVTLNDGTGMVASLFVDGINNVTVSLWTRPGFPTLRASSGIPRTASMWRYLEWYFQGDPVFGRTTVAIDGDTVLNMTGSTTALGRGPTTCTLTRGLTDDFYIGLGDGSGPVFYGDFLITGTAPAASGSVPAKTDVRVDQQFVGVAYEAPKQDVRVDQQFIIVAIKNRPGAHVRPQVVGNGRV